MKTRTTTRHAHATRQQRALASPVARAIARREVLAMQGTVRGLALECMYAEHGSEQRELLASVAFIVGIGAEVAAVVPVAGDNRAGLHQALAEVVRIACDAARWDAGWAAQLSVAMEVSAEVMMDDAARAMAVAPGARGLAEDVRAGRVRMDAVAPLDVAG
jgi:hypothetical protein